MKFPITRESLLAYDPVKEATEKKEEDIQGGLYQMLTLLRNEFEAAMPKDPSQIDTRSITAKEHNAIAHIKDNFQKKRFIWSNIQQKSNLGNTIPPPFRKGEGGPIINDHLPRFLEMVQENFIGCTVTINPLNTYIIIDWS